jgi:hypothetical protein
VARAGANDRAITGRARRAAAPVARDGDGDGGGAHRCRAVVCGLMASGGGCDPYARVAGRPATSPPAFTARMCACLSRPATAARQPSKDGARPAARVSECRVRQPAPGLYVRQRPWTDGWAMGDGRWLLAYSRTVRACVHARARTSRGPSVASF